MNDLQNDSLEIHDSEESVEITLDNVIKNIKNMANFMITAFQLKLNTYQNISVKYLTKTKKKSYNLILIHFIKFSIMIN